MEDCRLNCLPSDVKLNIFSKLPAESVLDCKLVCTAWRHPLQLHVKTIYFAYLHLRGQCGEGLIHQKPLDHGGSDSTMMSFVTLDGHDLYYSEYCDDCKMNPKEFMHYTARRINLEFPVHMRIGLVGSCNGLICLSAETKYKPTFAVYDFTYDEPFCISNPITREIMKLPRLCIDDKIKKKGSIKVVHGFGYHPLTNEYKVVRISYIDDGTPYESPYKKGQVDVYTLGSGGGWRGIGETNLYLQPNTSASVCVDGALHWHHLGSESVVAFDLANEEFYLLESPPCLEAIPHPECTMRQLRVVRGFLCVANAYFYPDMLKWDLWVLKKNKEVNSCYNTKEFYNKSPRWSKEYTMDCKHPGKYQNQLVALLDGGKILLTNRGYVFRYDLETHVSDNIWRPGEDDKIWAVPIPHMSSFVSLKALGEENVEILR